MREGWETRTYSNLLLLQRAATWLGRGSLPDTVRGAWVGVKVQMLAHPSLRTRTRTCTGTALAASLRAVMANGAHAPRSQPRYQATLGPAGALATSKTQPGSALPPLSVTATPTRRSLRCTELGPMHDVTTEHEYGLMHDPSLAQHWLCCVQEFAMHVGDWPKTGPSMSYCSKRGTTPGSWLWPDW